MPIVRFAAILAALAFASAGVARAAAPPMMTVTQHDIVVVLHQFTDAVNKGDVAAVAATCSSPSSIIDEIPPHHWQGATACADWAHALFATNKAQGITGGVATISRPTRLDVSGDTAYAVVPAAYTYKQHGKTLSESGATLTISLKKVAGAWKIDAWAWTWVAPH